ncbi:MAG TPA: RnfABCDGE type electron transport complex subunit G [Burkholderiales bacterium]
MSLKRLRESPAYPPALLGAVALAASAALAWAYDATRDHIAAAEAHDLRVSLVQVLPTDFADNDLLGDTLELDGPRGAKVKVHRARRGERVRGAVFSVAERGYTEDIVLLMGVDAEGTVLGVRILKHRETPGLGDKIEAARHPWIDGFAGKSLAGPTRWAVKKDGGDFDQFAGATITPRAVVKAVKGGLEFFEAHRREILGDES